MLDPTWRRVSGFHLEETGELGVVWLAHDTVTSIVHCYDAAIFRREVPVVIGEGIAGRGRWIPMAWRKQDQEFADKLLDAGINILPDPCADNQAMAEVLSREVWQRLRSSQFRVDSRVAEWKAEFQNFYRDKSNVPISGFPLMAATRHAVEMLAYARAERMPGSKKPNYPRVPIA